MSIKKAVCKPGIQERVVEEFDPGKNEHEEGGMPEGNYERYKG